MGWLSKTLGSIIDSIIEAKKDETEAYDSSATVLRDDGDILWVHIPGGVDETPIKKTIDAKRGDVIQVRVGGGTAWATGNQTAPPTDDTKAKEADTKAKDANILAKLAKKTADKAGKTATNYLSWSAEYGLIVSEDATEDPDEMEGGSTRVTYDGVEMYKGQTRVAKFGETSFIGDEDSAHAYLDPDTFNITNEYGGKFFSVDMDGATREVAYWKQASGIIDVSSSASIEINDSPDFDFIQNGSNVEVSIRVFGGGFVDRTAWQVTKGTAETTQSTSPAGTVFTLVYDGGHSFVVTWDNVARRSTGLQIVEYLETTSPSFVFGTREGSSNGAFSASMGEGLVASGNHQVVIGRYNSNNANDLFELGYGTSNDDRKNLFAITNTGKIVSTALDCGQITGITAPAGDTTDAEWVSFNHVFPSAPIVTASFYSNPSGSPLNDFGRCGVSVYGVTTTGFYYRVYNNGTVNRSPYVNWIAMLP